MFDASGPLGAVLAVAGAIAVVARVTGISRAIRQVRGRIVGGVLCGIAIRLFSNAVSGGMVPAE